MSIDLIVTEGFGNGTVIGTIKGVVTKGFGISTIIPPTIPTPSGMSSKGSFGNGISGIGETDAIIFSKGSTGGGITGGGSL